MKCLALVFLMACFAFRQEPQLHIILKNNSEKEKLGKQQLERIIKNYPAIVAKCVSTDTVVIDEYTHPPHSHPRLTLNTRYLDNDTLQLATFLHEGLHWMVDAMGKQTATTIDTYKSRFPDAPARGSAGARDLYSTYLHLIVCDLELQSMTIAIGEADARRLLSQKKYYTWIYGKVLNDPLIRETNKKNGFLLK